VAAVTLAAAAMVAMAGGVGAVEGWPCGLCLPAGHARDIVVRMCRTVNLGPKAQGIGC
jgi:hypothetical protein